MSKTILISLLDDGNYLDFITLAAKSSQYTISILFNNKLGSIQFDECYNQYPEEFLEIFKDQYNSINIDLPYCIEILKKISNIDVVILKKSISFFITLVKFNIIDINWTDKKGNNILQANKHPNILKIQDLQALVELGLDLYHINHKNRNFTWKLENCNDKIWQYLVENNFNFSQRDIYGRTVFHYKLPDNISKLNIEISQEELTYYLRKYSYRSSLAYSIKYILDKFDIITLEIYEAINDELDTGELIAACLSKILYVTQEYLDCVLYNDNLLHYLVDNYIFNIDVNILIRISKSEIFFYLIDKFNLVIDYNDYNFIYKLIDHRCDKVEDEGFTVYYYRIDNEIIQYLIEEGKYDREIINKKYEDKNFHIKENGEWFNPCGFD